MSAKKPTVAIFTGNSNTGSACIAELMDRYSSRVNVRGIFRSAEKAKTITDKYPKIFSICGADASKPETLDPAFNGVDSALIVTPHDPTRDFSQEKSQAADLAANMINAAVRNGVKYVVLVGSWTVKAPDDIKIFSSRFKPTEELLERLGREKGLKWTVLRGGFFMENLPYFFKDSIRTESCIKFPAVSIPIVDTKDIGKSAAACLVSNGDNHDGKFYEMSGPEILSGPDMAATLSKVLDKEIKCIDTSSAEIKSMTAPIAELFEYIIENGKKAVPFTQDVKTLTGQHGTLEQFLHEHKSQFI